MSRYQDYRLIKYPVKLQYISQLIRSIKSNRNFFEPSIPMLGDQNNNCLLSGSLGDRSAGLW